MHAHLHMHTLPLIHTHTHPCTHSGIRGPVQHHPSAVQLPHATHIHAGLTPDSGLQPIAYLSWKGQVVQHGKAKLYNIHSGLTPDSGLQPIANLSCKAMVYKSLCITTTPKPGTRESQAWLYASTTRPHHVTLCLIHPKAQPWAPLPSQDPEPPTALPPSSKLMLRHDRVAALQPRQRHP